MTTMTAGVGVNVLFKSEVRAFAMLAADINRARPAGAPEINGMPNAESDYQDKMTWSEGQWKVTFSFRASDDIVATWERPDGAWYELHRDGQKRYWPVDAEESAAGWPE